MDNFNVQVQKSSLKVLHPRFWGSERRMKNQEGNWFKQKTNHLFKRSCIIFYVHQDKLVVERKQLLAIFGILMIGLIMGPYVHFQAYQQFRTDQRRYGKIYDIQWVDNPEFLNVTDRKVRGNLETANYRTILRDHTIYWLSSRADEEGNIDDYFLLEIEFSENFKFVKTLKQIDLPFISTSDFRGFDVVNGHYFTLQTISANNIPELNLLEFNSSAVISNRTLELSKHDDNLFDSIRLDWFQIYGGNLFTIERFYLPVSEGGASVYSNIFSRLVKYDLDDLSQIDAVNLTFPYVRSSSIRNGSIWVEYGHLPYENITYYASSSQTITSGYYEFDLEALFKGDAEVKSAVFRHHGIFSPYPFFVNYNGSMVDFNRHRSILAESAYIIPYSYRLRANDEVLAGFEILEMTERNINYYIDDVEMAKVFLGYSIIVMIPFILLWRKVKGEPNFNNGYLTNQDNNK
ncbi:MAG: hypothetical protein D6732_16770 [Methanobacteriota archaeon]|nr:MAG: hypothetical protein D6732_16770 [Euryarchaeota archaeon]